MKIFLLFFSIFFVQVIFGQDTYYKSSIITLENDTIKGFISNIYDAKTIKFKKKKNDKPMVYTPQLLRGFILDGNVFETRIVNMPYYKHESVSFIDASLYLVKDKERPRVRDTVFLHKLVYGSVSLFKTTNREGFTYYYAQKNSVLKELPPQYCEIIIDTNSLVRYVNMPHHELRSTGNYLTYLHIKDDYLDTLGYLLDDKRYVSLPSRTFIYSEKNLSNYIGQYNKKKGIANGGLLKTKVSRKIFTGISAGIVALQYDETIRDSKINNSLAFKLYGLYPLSGTNRNVFAKFGFNYFSYRNDYYKKSIPSASFGLRYGAISGIVRPYLEGSLAIASVNKDNRPTDIGFPVILEAGVNVPIKDFFLTIGASATPITVYKFNGYKFWAFNIGVMF